MTTRIGSRYSETSSSGLAQVRMVCSPSSCGRNIERSSTFRPMTCAGSCRCGVMPSCPTWSASESQRKDSWFLPTWGCESGGVSTIRERSTVRYRCLRTLTRRWTKHRGSDRHAQDTDSHQPAYSSCSETGRRWKKVDGTSGSSLPRIFRMRLKLFRPYQSSSW